MILFGSLLAIKNHPFFSSNISTILVTTLAIIAGVFHGYAYGEAIVGAEMNPLVAYLAGFTVIQLLVAFTAWGIATFLKHEFSNKFAYILRIIGLVITSIGFVFFGFALSI